MGASASANASATLTDVQIVHSQHLGVMNEAFEVVERKGTGHPDTLCDQIAEEASREYSRRCLEKFDRVPHHWFDKVMLIGGVSDVDYGKGHLLEPYQVIFAGKAARNVGPDAIPIGEILFTAASRVLTRCLTGFDPEKHLVIEDRVRSSKGPGQHSNRYNPLSKADLDTFGASTLVSNDCNLCVGYAPLSLVEQLVLDTEIYLQSQEIRQTAPYVGHDIKVVGTRRGKEIELLVNVPLLAGRVYSFEDYKDKLSVVEDLLRHFINSVDANIRLLLNPERRWARPYLTATGSVADTGDVGVTGRGNRQNGLITPMRPMSMEATAGKNPMDHTGKLYGIIARDIARELSLLLSTHVVVSINTSKGAPLSQPDSFVIEVKDEPADAELTKKAIKIAREHLANVADLTRRLVTQGETLW